MKLREGIAFGVDTFVTFIIEVGVIINKWSKILTHYIKAYLTNTYRYDHQTGHVNQYWINIQPLTCFHKICDKLYILLNSHSINQDISCLVSLKIISHGIWIQHNIPRFSNNYICWHIECPRQYMVFLYIIDMLFSLVVIVIIWNK